MSPAIRLEPSGRASSDLEISWTPDSEGTAAPNCVDPAGSISWHEAANFQSNWRFKLMLAAAIVGLLTAAIALAVRASTTRRAVTVVGLTSTSAVATLLATFGAFIF